MGTVADAYAATNATTLSGVGGLANLRYYDKRFLTRVNKRLLITQLLQKKPLPEGNGKTIDFFRYLNLAVSVSGATLTEGQHPDATQFKMQTLSRSLAEYGAWTQIPSLHKQATTDQGLVGVVDLMSENAARTLDTLYHMRVCSQGIYPLAGDLAATSKFEGVVDSATSTTLVDAALSSNTNFGDANDDLNQSIVIITSGTGYGQARTITDYATATGTMTITTAWDSTPVAGDTYVVVTPDELTSADKLTYENLKAARTILVNNEAEPFDDGYFVALACPDVLSGLMDDTKWIAAHTYKDGNNLYAGEVGKFAGIRFIEETNPFRFPIQTRGTAGTAGGPGSLGANYSATGAVYTTPVFGKNSSGVTTFANKAGKIKNPPIFFKKAEDSGTFQPLNRYDTIGWALEACVTPLNPLFAVGIWTGA